MTGRPSLLLIPGSLNNARVWAHAAAALAGRARICIADISESDSTVAMATACLAEADGAGLTGPVAVAGFSLGGYVALEVLRAQPQRIAGLALISTSARPENPQAIPGREKGMLLATRDFEKLLANMRPFMLAQANLGNTALNAALDTMMREVGPDTFVRQSRAVIGRADCGDLLPGIGVPTLIACGREDKITPPALSEELARAIPGATLELMDNCGHMLPFEAGDALARLMAIWLDRIAQSQQPQGET